MKKIFAALLLALAFAFPASAKKAKTPMQHDLFMSYCATGKLAQVVKGVNSGVPLNVVYPNGFTPLLAAAEAQDNPKVIEYLVSKGADPNLANKQGLTPLMMAAMRNKVSRVTKSLLSCGADPYATDMTGATATYYAALSDNAASLKLLIAAAPETSDHPNTGGRTPMSAAVSVGASAAQKVLLDIQ